MNTEEPTSTILLYSKYSPRCKTALEILRDKPLNFIGLLCVDNETIRKKILSSNYSIKQVPCIMIGYSTGKVETYEADDCLRWLYTVINKFYPEPVTTSNSVVFHEQPSEPLKTSKVKSKPLKDNEVDQKIKGKTTLLDLELESRDSEAKGDREDREDREDEESLNPSMERTPETPGIIRAIKANTGKSISDIASELEKLREQDMKLTERKR